MRRARLVALCGALAIAATACGGDTATTVDVTLSEFVVAPSVTSAEAGSVTFAVTNEGPEDVHELVVFKTELGITELPVDENGAVVEDGEGVELMGEVEDVAVDASGEVALDLEAGSYVLICNIWDDGEQEAHYQEGMRASFTVT